MSLEQSIRDELSTLVEPTDPDQVLAEVAARRAGHSRRRRMNLVAAAAALVAIAAIGVTWLATNDNSQVTAGPGPTPSSTPSTVDPGDVEFEVLTVTGGGNDEMGTMRFADNETEFAALWDSATADSGEPLPQVDFAEQVVVSITVPDDGCAPTLERFDSDASAGPLIFQPVFDEPADVNCGQPLIPATFVVAIDWASTGDEDQFLLQLPPEPAYGVEGQLLDVARWPTEPVPTPGLTASLEFPTAAVAAGDVLRGEVVVQNDTGAPVSLGGCALYGVVLRNDEYQQSIQDLRTCDMELTLSVGTSRWPVAIEATRSECIGIPGTGSGPPCGANDSPPSLPAGTYTARAVHPDGAPTPPDVTIEVTPAP